MLTRSRILVFLALLGICGSPNRSMAQASGTIEGLVTRQDDGSPLAGVSVTVQGTGLGAVTSTNGRYTIRRVPPGDHRLIVRWVGFTPREVPVTVPAGQDVTADVALVAQPIMLGEIIVSAASRAPERVVEAPAAVTLVDTRAAQALSLTGQAPLAIANVPGVDVVQSGVNDININTRGFNSSLNRRILVLQDGRDLAVAFLGSQEWNALSASLEDMGRIEMVRGPGAALYGANAFAGVLNITTPAARDVVGTKLTLGGGELESFRGDLRHAGLLGEGKFGYKVAAGYNRSDTWSRSRTSLDALDMRREYTTATDPATVPTTFATGQPLVEAAPLNGQGRDPVTGQATGDREDLVNIYGTGRFDYYAVNGSVGTLEGGASRVQNEIFVTGIGRVQILEALRPWLRANWSHENYTLMAWYSGRRSPDSTASDPLVRQRVLGSGARLVDLSDMLHAEGQYNRALMDDRVRVVVGGSFRNYRQNTQGTLMAPADDDRSDNYYSGYGQVEFRPSTIIRFVAAGRFDDGDLFQPQFSPKGAIVITPRPQHAFRFTVNRAFQTPNYSEFFLQSPVAAPNVGPRTLELGLEQYFAAVHANAPGAAAAAGVPTSLPWDFTAAPAMQALALGNRNLDVEKVLGLEFGYKGDWSDRFFVSADFYFNHLTDFVTDLLPAVNPDYPSYTLTSPTDVVATLDALDAVLAGAGQTPGSPLRAPIPVLRANYQALASQLGNRLATLPNGQRAVVVSYTNAGEVDEMGVELGLGVLLTDEIRLDGSYTWFDFDVKSQALGDQLLPNTPRHKGTVALSYRGRQGVDFGLNVRLLEGYDWAAGVFAGHIPGSQTLNANLSYQASNNIRLQLVATNVLDQQRYQMYGGSVIGRRILGGITATF